MKFNVKFSAKAINDLDKIWEYIANVLKNPTAADKAVAGVLDKVDLLESHPEIGARLFFDNNLNSGYRYVIYNHYMAFYRILGDTVYIDRVIYGKRDYM
ncbi:MAG: type II toxin-antitoxin system RelE/ParE family toxin, partial [Ruminococcus sp.]|nr:type II toxin-antitoxin system RelE/ParE family toxin [Ruminococcus sp.]